jgi:hypothetical protein
MPLVFSRSPRTRSTDPKRPCPPPGAMAAARSGHVRVPEGVGQAAFRCGLPSAAIFSNTAAAASRSPAAPQTD